MGQAASLPERSPAQAHVEWLACELCDYVSGLNQRSSHSKKQRLRKQMKQALRAE